MKRFMELDVRMLNVISPNSVAISFGIFNVFAQRREISYHYCFEQLSVLREIFENLVVSLLGASIFTFVVMVIEGSRW